MSKSEFGSQFLATVWRCLKADPQNLFNRFGTMDETWVHNQLQNQNNNPSCGKNLVNRIQKQFCLVARWWLQVFRWTIIVHTWVVYVKKLKKNAQDYSEIKCSFNWVIFASTCLWNSWFKFVIVVLHCCPTRLILLIWQLRTFIGFQTWKKKQLGGQKFSSIEKVEAVVNQNFEDLEEYISVEALESK